MEKTGREKRASKTTNRMFMEDNPKFLAACKKLNFTPTKRQASKWRMKKGIVFNTGRF